MPKIYVWITISKVSALSDFLSSSISW
jgi:hypothetical protein